jgi:hypothetical protein
VVSDTTGQREGEERKEEEEQEREEQEREEQEREEHEREEHQDPEPRGSSLKRSPKGGSGDPRRAAATM